MPQTQSSASLRWSCDRGGASDLPYCELIWKAQFTGVFCVTVQGCPVGAYVPGASGEPPHEYCLRSGRYMNMEAARSGRSREEQQIYPVPRDQNAVLASPQHQAPTSNDSTASSRGATRAMAQPVVRGNCLHGRGRRRSWCR